MTWLGYRRPDGSYGARNYVLIVPGGLVATKICQFVRGTVTLATSETGNTRARRDRETVARFLANIGKNPNVAGVLVQGNSAGGSYAELSLERIADEVAGTGKPVAVLTADQCGGTLGLLAKGIEVAREMVWRASRAQREPADDAALSLGMKCGGSDATSGLVGNGVVGYVYDRLVAARGVAMFSENTEIIGAEHVLARRAVSPEVAEQILAVARKMEERGQAVGEDIRTINPVPANFAGGISTLEEKSLGAIHKAGSQPIQGVLSYGERPPRPGLYFVDNNANGQYLFPSYAAAGAQMVMFQLGGASVPVGGILDPSTGIVAPLLWLTANRRTQERAANSVDFCSAPVLEGTESLEEAGERLYELIRETASGAMTRTETIDHTNPFSMYLEDPIF
ncbi:MAG: UxaA family hydrolase [Chloroflexi bacterium]|nr:UxaA family hydrolase [Chloroflexota bacterium]